MYFSGAPTIAHDRQHDRTDNVAHRLYLAVEVVESINLRNAMEALSVQTGNRTEFIDITRDVQAAVGRLGVRDGVVTVFCPHTTGGLTINENADPDVTADMDKALDRAVPWSA